MDAIEVVYRKYKLQPKFEIRFVAHLTVFKVAPY